jgi:hypothetical protein
MSPFIFHNEVSYQVSADNNRYLPLAGNYTASDKPARSCRYHYHFLRFDPEAVDEEWLCFFETQHEPDRWKSTALTLLFFLQVVPPLEESAVPVGACTRPSPIDRRIRGPLPPRANDYG